MADNQTEEDGRDTPENTARLKANHELIVSGYDDIFIPALKEHNNVFIYDYKNEDDFKRFLLFIKSRGVGMKARPSVYEYFIEMSNLVAKRGTCCRRKVGCVLTNKHKHVLATGYNGKPKGFTHCSEGEPCSAAAVPSGFNLEGCEAIHAEQNALLQCKDTQEIDTAYVTLFPCVTCTKLLLNTSCKTIVYSEEYVQPEAIEMWDRAGRTIIQQPFKKGL
jgi:dCMP deaminase